MVPGLRSRRTAGGYTLIEMMVILAILLILSLISAPPLFRAVHRNQILGIARQTAIVMQGARLEAIKRNRPARVVFNFPQNTIVTVVDEDNNGVYDIATELPIAQMTLPSQTRFWGAGDLVPNGPNAISNLNLGIACNPAPCPAGGWAQFNPDGSASQLGAVRFGDKSNNFLEVAIATAGTGRVEIRKYDPADSQYHISGYNGEAWKWY